jgi:hypothetical protein
MTPTDLGNTSATLGTGLPGTASENMRGHLAAPTANAMTATSQVPAPEAKPVDRLTLEGSTPGDFRGQAAQPDPLKGNDRPVRSATGMVGS